MNPNASVAPAPPGVTSNTQYDSPDSKGLSLAISCIVIGTIFVSLRVLAKAKALKRLDLDDLFLVLGYCGAIAYFGTNLYANSLGFGRHLWDIPLSKLVHLSEWVSIIGLIYIAPVLCLKISFFLSFLNVFGPHKSMRYLCWIGMFCCTGFYIGIFFGTVFNCTPARKTFDVSVKGECRRVMPLALASGIFNCISDLFITVIPMPYIWALQMSWRKRLQVCIVFGMGIFCTAISFIRLGLTIEYAGKPDVFYSYWFIAICAHLEVLFGIMAASCLAAPLLMNKIIRPTVSSMQTYLKVRNGGSTDNSKSSNHTPSQSSYEERQFDTDKTAPGEEEMIINRSMAYRVERVDRI